MFVANLFVCWFLLRGRKESACGRLQTEKSLFLMRKEGSMGLNTMSREL